MIIPDFRTLGITRRVKLAVSRVLCEAPMAHGTRKHDIEIETTPGGRVESPGPKFSTAAAKT
jgi:hypothetical protein